MTLDIQNGDWQNQAKAYWEAGNYEKAASLYEQAVSDQPDEKIYYWYLGLLLLLQGQESEAQTCWLSAMLDGNEEEVEKWTEELSLILEHEAQIKYNSGQYGLAWLIRQHLGQLCPENGINYLKLIDISCYLDNISVEFITHFIDENHLYDLISQDRWINENQLIEKIVSQLLSIDRNFTELYYFIQQLLAHIPESRNQIIQDAFQQVHRSAQDKKTSLTSYENINSLIDRESDPIQTRQSYVDRGQFLMQEGRLAEAFEHYHQAITLYPNYPVFHLQLGLVLQYQGHLDRADGCYDQAISLAPNWSYAHYLKAINIKSAIDYNSQEVMDEWYANPKIMEFHSCKEQFAFYRDVIDLAVSHGVDYHHKTIADVGCGFGQLLLMIRENYQPLLIKGFDFSSSAVKTAQTIHSYPDCEFEQNDIYEGVNQTFDVVFCTEVLEHLLYPQKALINLLKMIKIKGTLILTVPNGRVDSFAGHINFWSPESWQVFIHENSQGFDIKTDVMESKENLYHLNYAIVQKL
ncbi:tetratricopeptide repeat protein [Roseofilum capinflatum]|uniref:Tetratricopeptide repeat protein n=1 Tax=Roseofilum capinflatum BLCC-M114 TaxID=3022440 RepID=A0ABT7B0G8_9CYAN|nr:tetratricopeptide repeat protein [Roseofilum capinflatum]MDJ1172663.1 tetratricopeptide repeat protein [Roseofilum capinflatum BLCC-M114]